MTSEKFRVFLRSLSGRFIRHKPLVLAGTIFLFLLLFYLMFSQSGSSKQSTNPQFVPVTRDTLFQTLTLSGTVHSSKAINLLAPMEWRYELQIVSLIPEGTQVQPGDTLLRFNTSKLQVELESARRELQKQEASLRELLLNQKMQSRQLQNQLTLARLNLEEAKLNVQKAKFESDVLKQQAEIQLKQAEIQLRRAKQAVKNAAIVQQAERVKMQMAVKNAQSDVNALKAKIRRFVLISPHAGMVVYGESWFGNGFRKIRLGDKVHAGDNLIELPDLRAMESCILINEIDVHKIHPGEKALLWLEARPAHTYHGVVRNVANISEPENFARGEWLEIPSSVRVFSGEVTILDPDSSLKPGTTIKTRVFLDTIPHALLIPTTAVGEKNGKPVVFTPKGIRQIEVGARSGTKIVVLKGLSEKDKVELPLPPEAVPFGRTSFYRANLWSADSLSAALKNTSFDTTAQKNSPQSSNKDSALTQMKKLLKLKLKGKAKRSFAFPPVKKGAK